MANALRRSMNPLWKRVGLNIRLARRSGAALPPGRHRAIFGASPVPFTHEPPMRSRERILANLESIYRESYERAKAADEAARMIDLDSAYMRDQLMLEILLDIRDLFSVAPAASGGSALEKLEALRRLARK
jgi:hypothetical protein